MTGLWWWWMGSAMVAALAPSGEMQDHFSAQTASDGSMDLHPTQVLDGAWLRMRLGPDLVPALQAIPGVRVIHTANGATRVMMDGLVGRALWCVDGWPVPTRGDGTVDVEQLPHTAQELVRVEVTRQPMSHVYGSGAMGGVINLVTRPPQATHASGGAMVGWLPLGRGVAGGSASVSQGGTHWGVYGQSSVQSTLGKGANAQLGGAAGAVWALHPRVVARLDGAARETQRDAPGVGFAGTSHWARLKSEMVILLPWQDTVELALAASAMDQTGGAAASLGMLTAQEVLRLQYASEFLIGHHARAQFTLLSGWGTQAWEAARAHGLPSGGVGQLRLGAMIMDLWRVSRVLAVEAALRVEVTPQLSPAWAPVLAMGYEPFRYVFARASMGVGYGYDPLWANPDGVTTQAHTGVSQGVASTPLVLRSVDASLGFEPGSGRRFSVAAFRKDFLAHDRGFEVGPLSAAVSAGQFAKPVTGQSHVQGVRLWVDLPHLAWGAGIHAAYTFLHQAVNDDTGQRLPYVGRHETRVSWDLAPRGFPVFVQADLAVEWDRVSATGTPQGPLVRPLLGAGLRLAGLEWGCTVDNALGLEDLPTGGPPRRMAWCRVQSGLP